MRISDWSSDVCSSDLHRVETRRPWSWAAAGRMVADRRFLAFVAAAGSAQASHSVFYGFGTIAWRRIGFDDTVIGMLWTLGVVAEIESEEHTSELQSLMRISYAAFSLKKKK